MAYRVEFTDAQYMYVLEAVETYREIVKQYDNEERVRILGQAYDALCKGTQIPSTV